VGGSADLGEWNPGAALAAERKQSCYAKWGAHLFFLFIIILIQNILFVLFVLFSCFIFAE
jgi:hypothetical protein